MVVVFVDKGEEFLLLLKDGVFELYWYFVGICCKLKEDVVFDFFKGNIGVVVDVVFCGFFLFLFMIGFSFEFWLLLLLLLFCEEVGFVCWLGVVEEDFFEVEFLEFFGGVGFG